jgi:RHS repeat-associated protein
MFLGVGTWLMAVMIAASTIVIACGGERTPDKARERPAVLAKAAITNSPCSFTVTDNSYSPSQWWGTITFTNNGPSSASNFVVEFDVPTGKVCTADQDAVPAGATLSPLVGTGLSAHTPSNHCMFTWTNTTPLLAGKSKTFHYSTNSNDSSFTSVDNLVVSDSMCDSGACGTLAVQSASYNGSQWWGTITIANDGPYDTSNYSVEFDVPSNVQCTGEADAIPPGATLSPLVDGNPPHTISNHCIFTWSNGPVIAAGTPKTFHYSANTQSSTGPANVMVRDLDCNGGGASGGGASTPPGKIVATGTDVGATPGQVAVGPSGTASYTVPLWTPAGRNGMTPGLALTYSSAGDDSPVGHGWSVAGGTSMIHRCTLNSNRSGHTSPVAFDMQKDRLCLDGKPLVLLPNTAPNGTQGAEYRTEPDSFAKITIDASDTNGPIRFTVATQDGLKHYYGSNTTTRDAQLVVAGDVTAWQVSSDVSRDDSVITHTTTPAQYAWMRGSVEDRYHNTIWFRYHNSQPNGLQEPLLDRIEYVDVSAIPTRLITFTYVARPTPSQTKGFLAGMGFTTTQMLQSIDMQVAGDASKPAASVRFYQLSQQPSASTGRLLLKSITEYDGNPAKVTGRVVAHKQPTTFAYQDGFAALTDTPLAVRNMKRADDSAYWGIQPVDLDHDGLDDIVYRARPEGATTAEPPHWFVRLSTKTGFGDPIDLGLQDAHVLAPGDAVIADFFGNDGLPDIAVPVGNNIYAFYKNDGVTKTTAAFSQVAKETAGANGAMEINDFMGKGAVSILRPAADGRWGYRLYQHVVDNSGSTKDVLEDLSTTTMNVGWSSDQDGWSAYSADLDFDGAAEFLAPKAGATPTSPPSSRLSVLRQKVNLQAGGTPGASDWDLSTASTTLLASKNGSLVNHVFFDQNGDGLPDAIRLKQGNTAPDLIINNGRGFGTPTAATDFQGHAVASVGGGADYRDMIDPGIRVLDFDGDGKQDILLVDNGVVRDSSAPLPATAPRTSMMVLVSQGSGFVAKDLGVAIGAPADGPLKSASAASCVGTACDRAVHNYRQTQVLDMNGDGLADIIKIALDGTLHAIINQATRPDVLTAVQDGMGKKVNLTYLPMSDASVYTPGPAMGGTCPKNQDCLPSSGGLLVRSLKVDNGIGGGQNEYQYQYNDQRQDKNGGGLLGFTSWTITDVAAHTVTTEKFDLEHQETVPALDGGTMPVYSQIGLPVSRTVTTTGSDFVRTRTTNYVSYGFVPTNGGLSYYTRLAHATVLQTETKGGVTTTMLDQEQFFTPGPTADDDLGLPPIDVLVKTNTPEGADISEVTSTFTSDRGKWLLGMETDRTTTNTAPSGDSVTRRLSFVPDLDTGAVTSMTIQPKGPNAAAADPTEYLKVEYTRPPGMYGLVTSVRRTDLAGKSRTDAVGYENQGVYPNTFSNALGQSTGVESDPGLGLPLDVTDPNGIVTSHDYDAFGRIRRTNLPGGGGASVSYLRDIEPGSSQADARYVAKIVTQVDGGGEGHRIINRLGQDIRSEGENLDGTFSFVTTTYNELGLVNSASRPAKVGSNPGATTSWLYDPLGRLTSQTRPEDGKDRNDTSVTNATSTSTYSGFQQVFTDDFGRSTTDTYTMLGHLFTRDRKNDQNQVVRSQFTYGAFGQLKLVDRRDGAGTGKRITQIVPDDFGRTTTLEDPDTGERKTVYNGFGEVSSVTDANLDTITYLRDELGRVYERDDKDGVTKFTWDTNCIGHLSETTVVSTNVKRQFFYDSSGRLLREVSIIGGQSYPIDYRYDDFGRVQYVSYPNVAGYTRLVVKNIYDVDSGELSSVRNVSTGLSYWTLKSTKVDGQIDEEAFGNGVISDYGYSAQTGRIGSIKTTIPGSSPTTLRSLSYGYWNDGNLRFRSDLQANQNERFDYDALGRIKKWSAAADSAGASSMSGWNVNYTVDDFGNLTHRTFNPGQTTGGSLQDYSFGVVPGTNRVQTSPWGTYTYDGNGNQTGRPGGETVTYTAFDLPKTMTGPQTASFLYDASGSRVKKTKSDSDYTLYAGSLYEKRVVGSTIDHVFYVLGGGRVIAQVMRREGGTETTKYLHDDHLGSVDTVTSTDSNGSAIVAETTKRDPYGNRVPNFNQPVLPDTIAASTNKVRLGFTAQEQDDELGIINMRGRAYDPRLGRFLTPDPIVQAPFEPDSYNRFSYVFNKPLTLTDPSGFITCLDGKVYEDGQATRQPCPRETEESDVSVRMRAPGAGFPEDHSQGNTRTPPTNRRPGPNPNARRFADTTQSKSPPANKPEPTQPAQPCGCTAGAAQGDLYAGGYENWAAAEADYITNLSPVLSVSGENVDRVGGYLDMSIEASGLFIDLLSATDGLAGIRSAAERRIGGAVGDLAGGTLPTRGGPPGRGGPPSAGGAPGNFDAARREAFGRARMTDPEQVRFSKVDPITGTVVEFKGPGGAKVGYDGPHPNSPGPYHDTQHISWQSAGKRGSGGAERGNIPYCGPQHPSRPESKE